MWDFPSWIEDYDGTVFFLTDKDLEEHNIPLVNGVSDDAIRKVFPGIKGVDEEGFPCPPEVAKAVNAGKMQKIMRKYGYEEIHLDKKGRFHCDGGPALVYPDGEKRWYRNGKEHNDNGPAVVWADGTKWWYQHGLLHNDNGPATVCPDGTEGWFQHGLLHNDDGPAVIYPDGEKRWYRNGKEVPPPNEQKENENVSIS